MLALRLRLRLLRQCPRRPASLEGGGNALRRRDCRRSSTTNTSTSSSSTVIATNSKTASSSSVSSSAPCAYFLREMRFQKDLHRRIAEYEEEAVPKPPITITRPSLSLDKETSATTLALSIPASFPSSSSSATQLTTMTSTAETSQGSGSSDSLPAIVASPPPTSFYRRTLPSILTSFTSSEGKLYFREALDEGHADGYFNLVGNFSTQSEPAYCGLSSLSMVLNALEVDPGRQWRGVWRWYSDEMLECCAPIEVVKKIGITFSEFACLARCNGLNVVMRRATETTKEQFISDVQRAMSSTDTHVVVSFSRRTLNQTGDGHFSPIGSYNAKRNSVLVLDVARFKYPCYWTPIDLLWEAMHPIDKATGLSRGYFVLSRVHAPITAMNSQASNPASNESLSLLPQSAHQQPHQQVLSPLDDSNHSPSIQSISCSVTRTAFTPSLNSSVGSENKCQKTEPKSFSSSSSSSSLITLSAPESSFKSLSELLRLTLPASLEQVEHLTAAVRVILDAVSPPGSSLPQMPIRFSDDNNEMLLKQRDELISQALQNSVACLVHGAFRLDPPGPQTGMSNDTLALCVLFLRACPDVVFGRHREAWLHIRDMHNKKKDSMLNGAEHLDSQSLEPILHSQVHLLRQQLNSLLDVDTTAYPPAPVASSSSSPLSSSISISKSSNILSASPVSPTITTGSNMHSESACHFKSSTSCSGAHCEKHHQCDMKRRQQQQQLQQQAAVVPA